MENQLLNFKQMSNNTELCELFIKHISDKCPEVGHSYSPEYYNLLKENRETFKNILEIGIGTKEIMGSLCGPNYKAGASLRAWQEFFPNAKIFGADIAKEVLFNDGNISCFYTDQSDSKELENTISEIKNKVNDQKLTFDLILDDGSHIFEHMMLTFKTLGKYVSLGGLYIIEDIKKPYVQSFIDLKVDGFELCKEYQGSARSSEWDNFVAYKKVK
jgi:hypothetical protein